MIVGSSIAALGTPSDQRALGRIRLASGRVLDLTWRSDRQGWFARPRLTATFADGLGMRADGAESSWKYFSATENPPPAYVVTPRAFGFQLHIELNPREFWDAGLRLQEYLTGEVRCASTTMPTELAVAWFELAQGDDFLSPTPTNHGVRLAGPVDTANYRWWATGWRTSPVVQPAADVHWYPNLYQLGPDMNVRHFRAWRRWVGGADLAALQDTPPASSYPPMSAIAHWYSARDAPVDVGAPVAEWADYSGRGLTLGQATASKRPTLRFDAVQNLRYVEFDGVDDVLKTAQLALGQPVTVFLVMRQRAGGTSPQVWLGTNGAGASLIYRGNDTDQLNVWAGGTDLTYQTHTWPLPWTVYAVELNGATTRIYENGVLRATGNAGGAGLNGIAVGASGTDTFPARLDLAELVVSYTVNASERDAVITYLKARNGIT